MSDALNALAHSCTQSILVPNTAPDTHDTLTTLRTDFLSTISTVYSNTTKLSIALNPSTPTYSAAIRPLKDLITHASTLTSNASFFLPSFHGCTLTEVHSVAQSVLTALENLARAHLSLIAKVPTKGDATSGTEEYISKTAVVHELIAQAKAADPQGLSRSNLVAVRTRWLEHSETVSDVEAMLEFEVFASDDGWDDPDLDLRRRMNC
ncbi:hypothetical protein V8E53_009836 [Lactarius tabidus]